MLLPFTQCLNSCFEMSTTKESLVSTTASQGGISCKRKRASYVRPRLFARRNFSSFSTCWGRRCRWVCSNGSLRQRRGREWGWRFRSWCSACEHECQSFQQIGWSSRCKRGPRWWRSFRKWIWVLTRRHTKIILLLLLLLHITIRYPPPLVDISILCSPRLHIARYECHVHQNLFHVLYPQLPQKPAVRDA
jgi:hypothetical protein